MTEHRKTAQGSRRTTLRLDSDALLSAVGLSPTLVAQGYAPGTGPERSAQSQDGSVKAAVATPDSQPDPSILGGTVMPRATACELPDMRFVSEVLTSTQHKVAAAQKRFWSFVLPDGHLLEPRLRELMIKEALMPVLPAQSAAMPVGQAQAAMQQFMPQKPQLAGGGVPDVGLDRPSDTRAAAMPGTPGHSATNVIDTQGGLDPMGMTVDGNNAAGVPKGFKMGADYKELWRSSQLFDKLVGSNGCERPDSSLNGSKGCEAAHSGLVKEALNIQKHAPGTLIGAAGGAALAPILAMITRKQNHSSLPWTHHAALGAGLGAGAGFATSNWLKDDEEEKTAEVHPFRPVNADPDFISRNWAWHVGEKARLNAEKGSLPAPDTAGGSMAAQGGATPVSPEVSGTAGAGANPGHTVASGN